MPEERPHLFVGDQFKSQEDYSPRPNGGGDDDECRPKDRYQHGSRLQGQYESAFSETNEVYAEKGVNRNGYYLEIKSDPERGLSVDSLEDLRSKLVRLLNVRRSAADEDYVTLYVDGAKKEYLAKKIEEYLSKDNRSGFPSHAELIESIQNISPAMHLHAFWTDDPELIPGEEAVGVEVWLRAGQGDEEQVEAGFIAECEAIGLTVIDGKLSFPERIVKVVKANAGLLEELTIRSDHIAEYRKSKETAAFLLEMEASEQGVWIDNLIGRVEVNSDSRTKVCIIDTGVNQGHPLLQPILRAEDCLAVKSGWSVSDSQGHGTLMAGVVGYNDLNNLLQSGETVIQSHLLESVKLIEQAGNGHDDSLWGDLTSRAVSKSEIHDGDSFKVFCMAISATDTRDHGRPSSWSASLDDIAIGNGGVDPKLFIQAAGNASPENWGVYPEGQMAETVHDPAQSWNALTIGAYTVLDELTHPSLSGYEAVAPCGGISPFTTSSYFWGDEWPLKPDVVFEGGNVAHNGSGYLEQAEDMSIISTHHDFVSYPLKGFNMTSAATAKAAWMAAKLQANHQELWPETLRGLIVHSAEWTEAMIGQFINSGDLNTAKNKQEIKDLVRMCGWGVPNIRKAMHSANDSLTLISEAEIQPFKKDGTLGKIDYYTLPWPIDVLKELPPETEVKMRVTLSYYIEPSPGAIGWKDRYRYASHGLRFKMKDPVEDGENFKKRLNKKLAETSSDYYDASDSKYWMLGSDARHRGSVHSDIWTGSPQALADTNSIAVFPVKGWWSERRHLGKSESTCRYSLIVSIETTAQNVDIYTPVAAQIAVPIVVSR